MIETSEVINDDFNEMTLILRDYIDDNDYYTMMSTNEKGETKLLVTTPAMMGENIAVSIVMKLVKISVKGV